MISRLAYLTYWAALGQLLVKVSGLLSAVAVSRWLGFSDYAAYAYLVILVSTVGSIATFGLQWSSSKYVYVDAAGLISQRHEFLAFLVRFAPVLWIVVGLIIVALPQQLVAKRFPFSDLEIVAGVVAFSAQSIAYGLLTGAQLQRHAALFSGVSALVFLSGILLACYTGSLAIAIFSYVAHLCLNAVLQLAVFLRRLQPGRVHGSLRPSGGMNLLSENALLFVLTSIPALFPLVVSNNLIGLPGSEGQMAYFAIGFQWFTILMFLPVILAKLLVPVFVDRDSNAERGDGGSKNAALRIAGAAFICSLLIASSSYLWSGHILRIYGASNAEWPFFCMMLFAAAFAAPVGILSSFVIASGAIKWLIGVYLVVLSILLIGTWQPGTDMMAVGMSYVGAYAFALVAILFGLSYGGEKKMRSA